MKNCIENYDLGLSTHPFWASGLFSFVLGICLSFLNLQEIVNENAVEKTVPFIFPVFIIILSIGLFLRDTAEPPSKVMLGFAWLCHELTAWLVFASAFTSGYFIANLVFEGFLIGIATIAAAVACQVILATLTKTELTDPMPKWGIAAINLILVISLFFGAKWLFKSLVALPNFG